jgi:LmbE family N-acetylglucosaminyl deacetylase
MTQNSFDISAVRTKEAAKSASMIKGIYHCLNERDGFVVYDKTTIQKAYDLFRRIVPSLVFSHAAKDYMMDHEQCSLLARAATFLYGAPNVSQVPRDPDSVVPHFYYCDPTEGKDPLGNPVTPTTLVDVSGVIDRKLEMLACHASQREWLRAHHGMDEYLEAVRQRDRDRGKLIDAAYAEAFVQHRGHAYPQNDLLQELFGTPKKG